MSIVSGVDYHPVGTISDGNCNHNKKKAHSCCGGCCDMRRAVIVVNAILLVGRTMAVMGIHQMANFMKSFSQGFVDSVTEGGQGDDTTKETIAQAFDDGVTTAMMVLTFGIMIAGLSIYGAVTYNKYLVASNAIYLALGMFQFGLLSIVTNGFFIYPHAFLIYYIHIGIISEENYAKEEQSCCCV